MTPLGLYVHVPFCASICHYCNFNRGLLDESVKTRYVRAVVREIERAGVGGPAPVDTIFFGGGTPSLLAPSELGGILDACRRTFAVSSDAEVTIEANPESATRDRLAAFRDRGVNRLSLGVQSFRDEELLRLGRVHDRRRAGQAIDDARRVGFDNLSLDLMMWLPAQTPADWQSSVEALVEVSPEHASLYMLELYPNAPLREVMARRGWSQSPDDDAASMYEEAMACLEAAGYEHYEISNVARPGRRSRHNLKYWTDGEWLGVGPGAHSTRGGVRWKNVSSTTDYLDAIESGAPVMTERRVLDAEDRWREAVMMGLRLADGIDLPAFREKYDLDLVARYGDYLRASVDAGLLVVDDRRMRLTRQGMLMANEVLAVFF